MTTANYDDPWKEALERYFEAFVAFFFAEAHRDIDWSRGYEFLDKEFQQIVREAEVGKRFVDKLVKVWLVDGQETWLLLHIEIQSQTDAAFAERMFTYHYRIFDRYSREVVSLAVLGDEQPGWRPQEYGYGRWGCEMRLRFPIVKLLDYPWEDLDASDNPFASVVMAHRKTQDTTQQFPERLQWKLHLIKRLYRRGYSRQDILELFLVLDRMMRLPEPLELVFRNEIRQFEEENQMPYISSLERIGRQEGLQEGLQEGRQEGRLGERQDIIRTALSTRFGGVDEELETVIEPVTQLPSSEFVNLLLSLPTLSREEVLRRFGQSLSH